MSPILPAITFCLYFFGASFEIAPSIYTHREREHVSQSNFDLSMDLFFFAYSEKIDGQNADFNFELKHLQDHVPKAGLGDYWNICQDIEENASRELTIMGPAPVK